MNICIEFVILPSLDLFVQKINNFSMDCRIVPQIIHA